MDRYKDNPLRHMGFKTIQSLETENGILASSKSDIYGCLFGRDSLITSLKLMRAYDKYPDPYLLGITKKVLAKLASLQGTTRNIESGEEPGKILHEYRTDNHEHLTQALERPWYVYPDNTMRNYDSVDSTPLFLIALYRYLERSHDTAFAELMKPAMHNALDWMVVFGDANHDGFLDYELHPERVHGGLETQSWMDSSESVFHEDGSAVAYPIAPVEVQAYAFTAYKLWADYLRDTNETSAALYESKADRMKDAFNTAFVSRDENGKLHVAAGIDGTGKPLMSKRSSIGHCLWTTYSKDGKHESILHDDYISEAANELMQPDMFEPNAGIRTLSAFSPQFAPESYHNGSIWPHDNAIIAEGMDNFGFTEYGDQIRNALMKAIAHFDTPIELFVYNKGTYSEYLSPTGHGGCREQAWCAAALVSEL